MPHFHRWRRVAAPSAYICSRGREAGSQLVSGSAAARLRPTVSTSSSSGSGT